jgi:UDP-N-acetyl-D-glucosamine dehydrogenase
LENTYRALNIASVNELKIVFDAIGIDICEVIEGAKTKPFAFQAFCPGPGLSAHCIPIDPFYLAWAAPVPGEFAVHQACRGDQQRHAQVRVSSGNQSTG